MSTLIELMNAEAELLARFREIEAEIEANEGEVSDELDAEFDRVLDSLLEAEDAIESKADSYGFVMDEIESEVESIKGREKPLKDLLKSLRKRRKARERHVSRMKDRLHTYLYARNLGRIEGDYYRFRRQKNGGRRKLHIPSGLDPLELPGRFQRVEIDTDAVRKDLEKLETLEERRSAILEDAPSGDGSPDPAVIALNMRIDALRDDLEGIEFEERGEHIRKY